MTPSQTAKPQKRAINYLRVRSVPDSDPVAQLHWQRITCTRIARQHGATVVHEYAARGGVHDSPARAMLDQVAHKPVDYIITAGIDRLCRGPVPADLELMRAIQGTGAALLCGGGNITIPAGFSGALVETHRTMLTRRPS